MEKRTPEEALLDLRKAITEEMERYFKEKGTSVYILTGVRMNLETYEFLNQGGSQAKYFDKCDYAGLSEIYKTDDIKSGLMGISYRAFVMIDESLAKGKVVIRHYLKP